MCLGAKNTEAGGIYGSSGPSVGKEFTALPVWELWSGFETTFKDDIETALAARAGALG